MQMRHGVLVLVLKKDALIVSTWCNGGYCTYSGVYETDPDAD